MYQYVSKLFGLNSIVRLPPVLSPTGTHCWHRPSRWPDKLNSTAILFPLLNRFTHWIDSNRLFPVPALTGTVKLTGHSTINRDERIINSNLACGCISPQLTK